MPKPSKPEIELAVAGQKAKASTYNDNFQTMLDYVDECMDYAVTADLSNLDSTGEAHFDTRYVKKTSVANKGSKTQPIYFDVNGLPTVCTGISSTLLNDATTKSAILNLLLPDYTAGITSSKSGSGIKYTCPADGIICVNLKGWNGSTCWVKINSSTVLNVSGNSATENSHTGTGAFPVKKNDVVTTSEPGASTWTQSLIFYPYRGA